MQRGAEAGFILVDALLAAAILAFAGTVVLTMIMSAEQRAGADLDRSVALTSMHAIAMQLPLVDPPQRARLSTEDELYRYAVERVLDDEGDLESLQQWRVTATPLTAGEPIELMLLAR